MSLRHWVWLSAGGPAAGMRLLDVYGSPERAYEAGSRILDEVDPRDRPDAQRLCHVSAMEAAEGILLVCSRLGVRVITLRDAAYPDRLRNIDNPPIVLYGKGTLPVLDDEVCIAVVGTRKAGYASLRIAQRIAGELAKAGVLIVSGMAEGIDSAAHTGALRAGGSTVAVFGCGPDVCYPPDNGRLMQEIEGRGCILSEYPPGTRPSRAAFPRRNRIISGLSMGVLIVAAPAKSGSLITAARALEQGRDVFAVPGGIEDPEFEGSNELIKQGATPVTDAQDILLPYYASYPAFFELHRVRQATPFGAISFAFRKKKKEEKETIPAGARSGEAAVPAARSVPDGIGEQDRPIVELLLAGPQQADRIVEKTGLETGTVLARLTILEVEGRVRQLPGKHFEWIG